MSDGIDVWSDYGDVCTVSTPGLPTTSFCDAYCESVVSDTYGRIYAISFSGATTYRFLLEHVIPGVDEQPEQILYSQSVDRTANYFTLSMFTGLEVGVTYRMRVALGFNGQFGPYGEGKDCTVSYVSLARASVTAGNDEQTNTMLDFTAVAYPNPFANNFLIKLTTASESMVAIKVYDMIGRLVEQREAKVSDLENTTIGNNFPSGVYNVVVTQNEEVQTLRVVKR